jgi:hypothetical protein
MRRACGRPRRAACPGWGAGSWRRSPHREARRVQAARRQGATVRKTALSGPGAASWPSRRGELHRALGARGEQPRPWSGRRRPRHGARGGRLARRVLVRRTDGAAGVTAAVRRAREMVSKAPRWRASFRSGPSSCAMAAPSVQPARGDAAGARGATVLADSAPRVTARGLAREPRRGGRAGATRCSLVGAIEARGVPARSGAAQSRSRRKMRQELRYCRILASYSSSVGFQWL